MEEPTLQAALPPVRAADLLTMTATDIAIYRDLSAHPGLNYGILSLMPPANVIATFGLT
jgi:hypothetical protein